MAITQEITWRPIPLCSGLHRHLFSLHIYGRRKCFSAISAQKDEYNFLPSTLFFFFGEFDGVRYNRQTFTSQAQHGAYIRYYGYSWRLMSVGHEGEWAWQHFPLLLPGHDRKTLFQILTTWNAMTLLNSDLQQRNAWRLWRLEGSLCSVSVGHSLSGFCRDVTEDNWPSYIELHLTATQLFTG